MASNITDKITDTQSEDVAESGLLEKSRFYLILFIIIFAVIFRAGNRPIPLMILELVSIALFFLLFLSPDRSEKLPGMMNKSIWALLLFPILYLIPVPWDIWIELPGREFYAKTLSLVNSESMRAISIYPLKTEMALLALLPPIAIFLAVLRLSVEQLKTCVMVLLGVAFLESVLGLIQFGDGVTSSLRFGNYFSTNGAEGTYANRNHLAGLLEMVLPIGLGLLALSIGHTRSELRYHSNWRSRLSALSGFHMNKSIIYGFVCIVILLALVFSQSRTGVALAMLGIFISTIAYAKRLGGTNVFGVIGTFTAVVVALAAEIGLMPLLQRFAVDHLENLRFVIFENTIKGIGSFFPLGSGPGTYPFIYPRFQSIEEKGFVNHAHNDYLEWLMEGGMIAGIFIIIFLWFYLRRWSLVWVSGYWSTFRFIQVGAGIGVFLMLLHGLTDFNLHIPANAIYFAFLAAVFFYPYKDEEEITVAKSSNKPKIKAKKVRAEAISAEIKTPFHEIDSNDSPETKPVEKVTSPEDIPNPFSEDEKDKDA